MPTLLQVDFHYEGPFGDGMSAMLKPLAESINQEPGMLWKIWTENPASQRAGGVYLFASEQTAADYLAMHSARLTAMGIRDIRGQLFEINQALSEINHAAGLLV
ncbi:monooxygenase [Shewanella sp. GXUN23E]|uniref:monooxygenase n=1 Tax=Shewanella sp. GXUN23E TaxID=3422498 RepID=UPI003D7D29F9